MNIIWIVRVKTANWSYIQRCRGQQTIWQFWSTGSTKPLIRFPKIVNKIFRTTFFKGFIVLRLHFLVPGKWQQKCSVTLKHHISVLEVWLFMLRCIMQPIVPLMWHGIQKKRFICMISWVESVKCYLTGREDELVTGQVRLITENVGLFHFQLVCDPQKPQ